MYMKEKQMKELAWNTFKQTGNINTFLELMQVENLEKNKQPIEGKNVEELYGNYQNQGNYPFGK